MSVERLEKRPAAPRSRSWRHLRIATMGTILLGAVLFGVIRLLHRAKAPMVSSLTASQVKAVPSGEAGKAGDMVITDEAMQLAEIKIAPATERTVSEKLSVSGSVEVGGNGIVKITPRVAGNILRLGAVVGDPVRAGQTLGLIESRDLARAQADFQQAASRAAAARLNLDRQRRLARLGAFSQPRVEEARRAAVLTQGEVQTGESAVNAARAQVAEAESDVKALEAALAQAQTQVKVLESRVHRADLLLKEQLLSRQEWEQTQADHRRGLADVDAARARIDQGKARVETAQAEWNAAQARMGAARKRAAIEKQAVAREEQVYQGRFNTSKELLEAEATLRQAVLDRDAATQAIRLLGGVPGGGSVVPLVTPIAGRVQERSATLGETVDIEHPLFTIVNLDTVWAQLAIPARDLSAIHTGQQVVLTADTAPGRIFTGTVSSIGSTAEEATRAVRIRVALSNRDDLLTPGALVHGHVVTDVRRKRLTVPVDALQEHNGRPTVYLVKPGPQNAFSVLHVTLGTRGEGWREIASGLVHGDRIAVSGTFYLKSEALKSALSDGCCALPGGK